MHPAVARHVARTEALKAAGLIPPPKPAPRPKAGRCRHLGNPTGQSRPCQGCGGRRKDVPLLACAVYGVCAVGKAVTLEDGTPVRPCSSLCPGYSPAGTQT